MSETFSTPVTNPAQMQRENESAEEQEPGAEWPAIPFSALQPGVNLATILSDEQLEKIGADCKRHIERDDASRKEWLDTSEEALDLAMQVAKEKTYPFERAANVVYPLITSAAIQFAQRAYTAVVPSDRVVKCTVVGDDSGMFEVQPPQPGQPEPPQPKMVTPPGAKAERADRVSKHMSWQCLHLIPEWEPEIDQLLHYLPIAGCAFRKTTYDAGKKRPSTRLIYGDKFIISNKAKSIAGAARYTIKEEYYPFEIIENIMKGEWRQCDLDAMQAAENADLEDDQAERTFYEHHCRLDLDGSGYPKPYIVTMHEEGKVVRIEMNWTRTREDGTVEPRVEYVKYSFMPNPKGGFYDVGFGWLMKNMNLIVNATINQLLDAGHWQNAPTGFIGRGIRLGRGGEVTLKPNAFKHVDASGEDLARNIWVYQHPGPSLVMFQLLGMLVQAGKDISSVQDVMQGRMEQNVAPMTMMNLVEQGMAAFTAIFKRIHRSLKAEFGMLYRINSETLPAHMYAYGEVLDNPQAVAQDDYNAKDQDVKPVTDPNMVSDQVQQMKAQYLTGLAAQGLVDPQEATKRALTAANIEDPEALLPKQDAEPNPMQKLMFARMQLDLQKEKQDMENERIKLRIKADETLAKIKKMRADALKSLAEAEAAEEGTQINVYKAQLETLDRAIALMPPPEAPAMPQDQQQGQATPPQFAPPPAQNGLAGMR